MVSLRALCALLIFKLPPPIQEQLTDQHTFFSEGVGESKREEAECLIL